MDNHQHWQQPAQQYNQAYNQQYPFQEDGHYSRAASDSVQEAQGLLAVYPMASANPTNHVARHLSTMSLSAEPPTFAQPSYYSVQNVQNHRYTPGNPPPPYTEYAQELAYMNSHSPAATQSNYWVNTRDNAAQMLNTSNGPAYSYQTPQHWMSQPVQHSSYTTTPFAQSMFQRTMPQAAYPTPPPPSISLSSSSLAYALGPPQPPQPPKVYKPEESAAFFDDFLQQKTQEMNVSRPAAVPPTPMTPPKAAKSTPLPVVDSSPDPLAMQPSPSVTAAVTPSRKRKVYVQLESPAVKRIQSSQSLKPPSKPAFNPQTPKHQKDHIPRTPGSQRMAYVAVPPKPWLTTPQQKENNSTTISAKALGKMKIDDSIDDDEEDLGGFGEDDSYSPMKVDTVKSSARRTGDRDERPPLEKFISLVEDIFEAEDSLPADVDLSDLPGEYFSHTTTVDASRPVLHPTIVHKLIKVLGNVARPTKRLRAGAGAQATPRAKGRMADVDTQMLSRLLKTLERSVKAGEDIDPFPRTSSDQLPSSTSGAARMESASPSKKSPKKAARGKKNEKSSTPGQDGEGQADSQESNGPAELSDSDHDKLARALEIGHDSVVAADCCIALLVSDRLTKQLYSEELITSCLGSIKNQLTKIIYPFVEAYTELSSGSSGNSLNPALYFLLTNNSSTCQANRRQLSEIFQALSSVIPRVNAMVNAESVAMSDAIIIQAVYIAIGPFFVVEGTGAEADGASRGKKSSGGDSIILKTFGKSAMRGLRLDALALIRSIFANHEDQRSWIIEEILSSLIKLSDTKQKAGQFRLRDGRSIRTVSALLLQLVQTSAHDVRIEAKRLDKARQNKFALKRQESLTESQLQSNSDEPFMDEIDRDEIQLYGSGLESATKAAKTIVLFLTQRSGKGKATKNSNEAEYRTIFDNLIADLLVVLFWPEWPAASLLLSVACKYMVSSLDDIKTSQTDSNAAKSIALDHLGVVASRIRSSTLKVQSNTDRYEGVKPLDEIVANSSRKEFKKLVSIHKDIAAHLCKRSSEDQAYDSAREFTAATLGHELSAALKQIDAWITDPSVDDDLNIKDTTKLEAFGQSVKEALQGVWKDPSADVFDIGSQEEVTRIDRLAEEIGTIQSLRNSFQPILTIILMALDAPAIFMRTKALKALGQIITSDATILSNPNVRRSIESHLLDSSPAVRDAAVELIGKYMIDSPEVAGDYYQKIADRIADTGLGVRKRVIKLLKSYYGVIDDSTRRIDISTRIVLRMFDEDETVRDLAAKTIEELWFPSTLVTQSSKPPSSSSSSARIQEKAALLNKVTVIMGTSSAFKDRQSPLEDLLHKIMADKSGHEATFLHERYAEICETLIDGLVDASELPGFTVINCVRTIHLFASAHPTILSGSRASTLLPYLKNGSSADDQSTSDYLLKIFRISVPHMPKTAAKFGQELQLALQPMVLKPSGGGALQILQEAVACMCIVIQNLTHDFGRLVNLLKSCNARLQQFVKRPSTEELPPNDVRSLSVLVFIVSLLGENCDFDQVRRDRAELAKDIDSISLDPIIEHIYLSLLSLYNKYNSPALRSRLLQCLGFLFRAQPTLMTMEQSSKIMDDIFASPEEDARGRLLRILQEFLVSESAKHAAKEKESGRAKAKLTGVNMDELVGNTDGFADSGVSSAVVQRYLNQILDAALSLQPAIQATAIDVLTFTIKQGLAHPLQSFPVIVALETSPTSNLSNRASALHAILNNKHASLLNARFSISARASFDYQRKISNGNIQGYRMQNVPVALLQRWYSHVREKRQPRQDFLKALVKVFQESPNQQASQDDIDFIRYMAENFSAFEYKTNEEVITIIKYLTTVLSTTGVQLLETVSPSHLLSHLQASSTSQTEAMDIVTDSPSNESPITDLTNQIPIMRSSVIIAMVMLLKTFLKNLYSLSEEKCNKFVLGKKSAVGDKATTRRHANPIDWQRLPFATTPILTSEDVAAQKQTFLSIWNEDGVTEEPEEEAV